MMYSDRDHLCVYVFFVPQTACRLGLAIHFLCHGAEWIRRGQHHRHEVALTAGCAGRSERPPAFVRRSREAWKAVGIWP